MPVVGTIPIAPDDRVILFKLWVWAILKAALYAFLLLFFYIFLTLYRWRRRYNRSEVHSLSTYIRKQLIVEYGKIVGTYWEDQFRERTTNFSANVLLTAVCLRIGVADPYNGDTLFKVAYMMELEKLPPLIEHEDPIVRAVVRWRLELGR